MIRETKAQPARKPKAPSPSEILLQSTLQPTGKAGEFDVVIVKAQQTTAEPNTTLEAAYLQRAHTPKVVRQPKVNTERVDVVRRMLSSGYTCAEIAAMHRGKHGYGLTQIKKDKAALLKAGLKIEK